MTSLFDRRMKVAALLLLGFWVLIWNGDALFGSTTWYFHDLKHHHYPWRVWAGSAWANNELPLWAPIAHGYPLMADGQAGVLYPVNIILYYLLPTHIAFNLSVIIHHLAAAWGGFALARVMGRTPRGALIAGIIYGFSGLLITHLVYLGMFQVIALTPWMLAAAAKGVKDGWLWWIVAGLLTGMAW